MTAQVSIIAGPARSGKTRQILSEYRGQLAAADDCKLGIGLSNCCWIGPNWASITQIRDNLLLGSSSALLRPNLFTFASFADSIIHRSDQLMREISPSQKRRLLQHVIRAAARGKKLDHFARVADTPGFVAQVDEQIAELKRSDIWPEQYEKWSNRRPKSDRRTRELAILYSAYQAELHRGELYDAEGRFWAAREILAAERGPSRHAYDLVVVNGFNDFTSAQYDILKLLAERSERMLFSLTTDNCVDAKSEAIRNLSGNPKSPSPENGGGGFAVGPEPHPAKRSELFAKSDATQRRLRKVFPELVIEQLADAPSSRSRLAEWQSQAFREAAFADSTAKQYQGIEIIAASSELSEVEAIARSVKSLLVGSTKPDEIVVVHRGGEDSISRIATIFEDFGIPFATENQPRLGTEPIVRALGNLLRLSTNDWPFQTLLEVIGNGLFARWDTHASEWDGYRAKPRVAVELSMRSAQLPSGRDALLDHLRFRLSKLAEETSSRSERERATIEVALLTLQQLNDSLAQLPETASINEWITAIEELFAELGVLQAEDSSQSRSAKSWRQLRGALRQIEQIDAWCDAQRSLDRTDFQQLMEAFGRETRLRSTHDDVGRVRVLSAESARKLSVKHLFLAGLTEQAFSSVGERQTPETGESIPLGEQSPDDIADDQLASTPHSDAMLLLYELVTRATEGVTLSYPALDSKGQSMPPSPLLSDLERSLGAGRIARHEIGFGQTDGSVAAPIGRSDFRRAAVAKALDGKQQWLAGMVSHTDFARVGGSVLNGLDCVSQRAEREEFGAYEGLLHSEQARSALAQRFNAEHLWSPSRLEGYSACPFRFFAERMLNLEPLEELTVSNDARRRGSLLHLVLATIHEQLRAEYVEQTASDERSDPDAEQLVSRFLEALDRAVKAKKLRGIEQSLREIERREIESWAPSYAQQEMNYRRAWQQLDEPPRPAHFEVRFGPEAQSSEDAYADAASKPVPFELDLGAERIRLTGQIDRVDLGRVNGVTVFNIIDYKSGKGVLLKHDKVRSGLQLQLPLYAMAAEQLLLDDQGALALATGYWNIQGNGFQVKRGGSLQLRELKDHTIKDSEEWKGLQPEILSRVQEIIAGVRRGDFPVYNEDEHCTRSCSLSTLCRISQIRSLDKQWHSE